MSSFFQDYLKLYENTLQDYIESLDVSIEEFYQVYIYIYLCIYIYIYMYVFIYTWRYIYIICVCASIHTYM
jgi:hypothetical protein